MNVQTNGQITGNQTEQPGGILRIMDRTRKPRAKPHTTLQDQPRATTPINDNYCIDKLQEGLLARSQNSTQRQTMNTYVNSHVVKVAHTAPRHSQRKEISPGQEVVIIKKSTN